MAEELAACEVLGQCTAIHCHKGLACARASKVDLVGHVLLACSGLAGNEHAHGRGCHQGNVLRDQFSMRASTFHVRALARGWCSDHACGHARLAGQCFFNALQDLIGEERLHHIVESSAAHEVHGDAHIGIAGDDDHHRSGIELFDAIKELQAVGIGQPVVAQHQIESLFREQVDRHGSAARRFNLVAFLDQ